MPEPENRTEELSAQLQSIQDSVTQAGFKTVDDLVASHKSATEERDKFKSANDDAREIIQRHGSKIGELEAKVAEIETKSTPEPDSNDGTKPPAPAPAPAPQDAETAEQIEASLDEGQREEADAAYEAADDETKQKIHGDEEYRKKFFSLVRDKVQTVPDKPWKRPAEPTNRTDPDEEKLQNLFKTERKRGGYVPPAGSHRGSRSGAPRKMKKSGEQGKSYLNPNDTLGGLERSRQKAAATA